MMPRWIQALLAAALGLAAGLFYGWRIAPVEYIDASPGALHADYRSDYAIMVAEAYQTEGDLDLAARRLALLGSAHPAEIIQETLDYIQNAGFSKDDIENLEKLMLEIQPWQPSFGESVP